MTIREGNLEPPKREPIPWKTEDYYNSDALDKELERVFDVCHGCRRCVSLCNAFPTLFDLVDESDTFEVDGVDKEDFVTVVDECFLCDLCAETKCPYLPPHEWAIDFPHLMLRAKAQKFENKETKLRDRLITTTDVLFEVASKPGIAPVANAMSRNKVLRSGAQSMYGIHKQAPIPKFESQTAKKRLKLLIPENEELEHVDASDQENAETSPTSPAREVDRFESKVAIYVTCYGNANEPEVVESLIKVLQHNSIGVSVLSSAKCCGMPKLELGDLKSVEKLKQRNIPIFMEAVRQGRKIMSVIPSCTLMYRQEIPLLFPDDPEVLSVKDAFVDPFEHLIQLNKTGHLNKDFQHPLGRVTYHAACHQRVQNIGQKTREFLSLIPDTEVTLIERCSGADGTYSIRAYDDAMKIARPVIRRIRESNPDSWGSDCPMAGRFLAHGLEDEFDTEHPLTMVARAYGLE